MTAATTTSDRGGRDGGAGSVGRDAAGPVGAIAASAGTDADPAQADRVRVLGVGSGQDGGMGRRLGVTLVEMLLLVAVLGMVLGLGWTLRPSWDAGRRLAAAIVAARAEALVLGGRVSLDLHACPGGRVIDTRQSGGTDVVGFPARGLMFTADGLPRTCDGSGVGNATILLEHRGRRAAVIVSSLGRVRWEPR